jgi:hypothetical protein
MNVSLKLSMKQSEECIVYINCRIICKLSEYWFWLYNNDNWGRKNRWTLSKGVK